jgi:hypothetical protein
MAAFNDKAILKAHHEMSAFNDKAILKAHK